MIVLVTFPSINYIHFSQLRVVVAFLHVRGISLMVCFLWVYSLFYNSCSVGDLKFETMYVILRGQQNLLAFECSEVTKIALALKQFPVVI